MSRSTAITRFAVSVGALPGLFAAAAFAGPVTLLTDTTPGTATNDGFVNPGEYATSAAGLGGSFGDVIGPNSRVWLDTDLAGQLNIGHTTTTSFNDTAVMYIDALPGGVASTASLNDQGFNNADATRRAISGSAGSLNADLNFGANFRPDFALAWNVNVNEFAGLFRIQENASHTFVTSANLTGDATANVFPTDGDWEMSLSLADLGLVPGDAFNYVVTYLNDTNAFRSNEFQGVATVPNLNIGQAAFTLGDGDFNTFRSIPEPITAGLLGVGGLLLLGARSRAAIADDEPTADAQA